MNLNSLSLMLGLSVLASAQAADKTLPFFIGTYTDGASKGIYHSELNLETGAFRPVELAGETNNPSFLAIHPSKSWLFAVNEIDAFIGRDSGSVSAFAIDPATHKLRFLNAQASGGAAPCHLVIDRSGKHVLVANYGGGSVGSLPIGEDGQIGSATSIIQNVGASVDLARQQAPHAHSINLDAANRFAFVADLGLDKILSFRFDPASGTLRKNEAAPATIIAPGAGPRHFAFHPQGKFAYVINEIALSITAMNYDAATGALSPMQTISTLPPGTTGQDLSTAEVVISPNGKFLYGSNRGHHSIAVFQVDEAKGTLRFVEAESTQGRNPRNFVVDPTGRYLLAENQDSDSIVSFRIDPNSGALDPTGHRVEVPKPVCIRFLP